MKTVPETKSQIEIFEDFRHPKIRISENTIFISDPPIGWRNFLVIFCIFLVVLCFEVKEGQDKIIGVTLALFFCIIAIYNAISLHRVRIDLKGRIIYFRSLNPIENLLNRILKRSTTISFSNVEKIYCDYPVLVGHGEKSYDLYLRSRGGYKLKIGIFKKEAEATSFTSFLKSKIK
jgi:hypothetical protein